MKRKIEIKDYLIHGLFFFIYGIFKYFPSPIGDIFRKLVISLFVNKKGNNVRFYEGVTLWYPYRMCIGSNVTFNENVYVSSFGNVSIGNNVRIGHDVSILSSDHSFDRVDIPIWKQGIKSKPTNIGNDVYIGCKAIILGGVKVGDGSIIGSGSVVTRNVPPYTIVAGNPARIIRKRNNGK